MPIGHINDLEGKPIINPEVKGAVMKVPVSKEEGWTDHVMRVFEIEGYGYTPRHTHPWPHINYVLEGSGTLFLHDKENPIEAGSYAYVPSGELHQFKNLTDKPLKFICIVPNEGHY